MKKVFVLFLLLIVLNGCQSESTVTNEMSNEEVTVTEVLFEEIIISGFDGDRAGFYNRLTSSYELFRNPSDVEWTEAKRVFVVYTSRLFELFPPSYFGSEMELNPGEVLNITINNIFFTFIYPDSRQTFSSLEQDISDELFVVMGSLVIEDYFKRAGTLIVLDNNTRVHQQLFDEFPDPIKNVSILSNLRAATFETIVFIYSTTPPNLLLDMSPPELPEVNHILEFTNQRSQRVVVYFVPELFSEQYITKFINQWGTTYTNSQLIIVDDAFSQLDQSFLDYRELPRVCRIASSVQSNVLAGFPLPPLRMTTIGNVRAKVVYLDFLDYRLNESGQKLEERFLKLGNDVNKYFDAVSYGQMRMEWDIHPEPLLMPKNVKDYELNSANVRLGYYPTLEIVYQMLELHRDSIDFSNTEVIVVMFNPNVPEKLANVSPAHPVDRNRPFVTNQGDLYNAVTIASEWPDHKWQVIVHELAHTMGLIDLYDYGITENWNDHHRHVGGFDIMGAFMENLEFLGWNRYLMNWVEDDQVFCTKPSNEKITIPIQTIGAKVNDSKDLQMIVIPLGRYKVMVIEAKEKNQFCLTCDGLLVYTVDTTIDSGRGAIKVIPIDRSTHVFKNDAMIRVGESLETNSIRVSLISASPNGYIVEINRVN